MGMCAELDLCDMLLSKSSTKSGVDFAELLKREEDEDDNELSHPASPSEVIIEPTAYGSALSIHSMVEDYVVNYFFMNLVLIFNS